MRFFWISKFGKEKVRVVNKEKDCRLIDTAVLIKLQKNEEEALLLGNDNSVENSAELVIEFLKYEQKEEKAKKLEELNSKFYKICKVWDKLKSTDKTMQSIEIGIGLDFNTKEAESINDSFSPLVTAFSSFVDSYKNLIQKKLDFYRNEIVSVISISGFEIISVWADSFKKNSFNRKRSLNFTNEPVEIRDNVHVQVNRAYKECLALFNL